MGGLGATYDDHLRLIGKPVVDFLLVLIELFSLGIMAEAAVADWPDGKPGDLFIGPSVKC